MISKSLRTCSKQKLDDYLLRVLCRGIFLGRGYCFKSFVKSFLTLTLRLLGFDLSEFFHLVVALFVISAGSKRTSVPSWAASERALIHMADPLLA